MERVFYNDCSNQKEGGNNDKCQLFMQTVLMMMLMMMLMMVFMVMFMLVRATFMLVIM